MEKIEERALSYLTERLRKTVRDCTYIRDKHINEIRLRLDSPLYLTVDGVNVGLTVATEQADISYTLTRLTDGSLYSYAQHIKEGFITTEDGIRAGISGTAVLSGCSIASLSKITSVNLRIPHRIKGAGDELYRAVMQYGSTLVYSPPGLGKTTALRELISLITSSNDPHRVAVIDSRYELTAGLTEAHTLDKLVGYPRPVGIEIATRAMSPEYIITDEIATQTDADAIMSAHAAGIMVVASVHGASLDSLRLNRCLRELLDSRVFRVAYRIDPDRHGTVEELA